jgi:hypothetical protein
MAGVKGVPGCANNDSPVLELLLTDSPVYLRPAGLDNSQRLGQM